MVTMENGVEFTQLNDKCDNIAMSTEDNPKPCDLNVSHDLIKELDDVNVSPPHTPTSGILKRISQFDTPNTSGKVCSVVSVCYNFAGNHIAAAAKL